MVVADTDRMANAKAEARALRCQQVARLSSTIKDMILTPVNTTTTPLGQKRHVEDKELVETEQLRKHRRIMSEIKETHSQLTECGIDEDTIRTVCNNMLKESGYTNNTNPSTLPMLV